VKNLDENRIVDVRLARPRVRIANRHPFVAGERWGPRTSVDPQVVAVRAGLLRYRPAGAGERRVGPGRVLFVPGGRRHVLRAERDGELAGFHAEFDPARRWADGGYRLAPAPATITDVRDLPGLRRRFADAAATFVDPGRFRAERLSAIVHEILLVLAERWGDGDGGAPSPRLRAMCAFIRARAPATTDRHDLAREFALSPAHVNDLFRRELGTTPTAVCNRERCLLAHRLLGEGARVADAAEAAGFNDPFHFSRVYKRHFGTSPRHARG